MIGTLIQEIKQPNGDVVQTYEVEVMGEKIRYIHILEKPHPPRCKFTQNEIILN